MGNLRTRYYRYLISALKMKDIISLTRCIQSHRKAADIPSDFLIKNVFQFHFTLLGGASEKPFS